jgi:hypothetical protein
MIYSFKLIIYPVNWFIYLVVNFLSYNAVSGEEVKGQALNSKEHS